VIFGLLLRPTRLWRRLAGFTVAAMLGPLAVMCMPATALAGCGLPSDFDNDGFSDVAVGEPWHPIDGDNLGGLRILYGSSSGVGIARNQYFDRSSAGMPEFAGGFGTSVVSGDFNGDCYADLAAGRLKAPGDQAILIMFGSPTGITTADALALKAVDLLPENPTAAQQLGKSLVSGDFDGDGSDDLVVSAEQLRSGSGMPGAVIVLYGSPGGLERRRIFSQATAGVPGTEEDPDFFGASLAAADFNGDGRDDLAAGVPGESIGNVVAAGGVTVLYGSVNGLTTTGARWIDQNTAGVPGTVESSDFIGYQVAAGDVTGDGYADLIVGGLEDFERIPVTVIDAGSVTVLTGGPTGISTSGAKAWHQDTAGVPGGNEAYDRFGIALALGRFNGDNRLDLAVSALHEDLSGQMDAGAVTVLYGTATGLTSSGAKQWSQDTDGIAGAAEEGDEFGSALHAAGLGSGSLDSLIIGVDNERVVGLATIGMIHILRATTTGLTATASRTIRAADLVPGSPGEGEFGWCIG